MTLVPDLALRLQASVGRKFRIARELTGGGMARVFLAEEVELQREVAIKVLTPQVDDAALLQRFRNEVLHTTRLQHPTIVSVFEVGTIEGDAGPLPYYVMPYVRGESLRSRLKQEGSLSLNAVLRILRNVLDALSHAHAHGVIHRDIKPENVFLAGTSAVVADFGVAKALAGPQRPSTLTTPGTTVGTPAYMAPEQLAGDSEVDARADLYSVGVLTFEMLTGRLPWEANNTAEMLAAKVKGAHSPLRAVRPDVPPSLASAIEQCLAWDPADRPPSAEALMRVVESVPFTHTPSTPMRARALPRAPRHRAGMAAVAGIAAVAAALWMAQRASLARAADSRVVRLAVLSPRVENPAAPESTLSHQLYHQLVAGLYPVPGIELVYETEISRMSELGVSPEQVVQKLRGEGYDSALVMETVAGADGELQVQLGLQHLQRPRREAVGNPIVLRSRALLSPDSARSLAGLLVSQVVSRFKLAPAERAVRETESSDAGIARARGRDAVVRRTPQGIREAIGHYERAIQLDSSYAQAHADLADALALALFYRYGTGESSYAVAARALRHAERAIQLQPTLAEGYTARGYTGMVAGAPVSFVRQSYDRARQLHPENPNSRLWYVGLLALENRYTQALDTLREMIRLDPGSPGKRISVALYSLPPHRYDDVVSNARQAGISQPGFPFAAALQLWGLLLRGGDRVHECLAIDPGPYLGARAMCVERVRGRRTSQPVVDSLFQLATNPPPADSHFDASVYAAEMAMHAGAHREWDSARQWMRRAFQASPLGVEPRFLRSGLFNDELVRYGESLRVASWRQVDAMARRATDSER